MQNSRQKFFKITFVFLACMIIGMLILGSWAWYSNIEESVTGIGQLVPQGKLRRIMAPVNGTIAKVNVQENQEVKAGQVLIELDPEYSQIQKNTFSQQLSYLQQEANALKAATGKVSDTSNLNSTQTAWLQATKSAYQSQVSATEMQIKKTEHLQKQALEREKNLQELLASNHKLLEKQEQLFKEGGIAENEVELQRQKVVEYQGELASTREEIKAREAEYKQALEQIKEINGSYQKEILTRLAEHEQNILRFSSEVARADVDVKRQIINSPIDGIVNEQAVRGEGEVATVGQILLSLVPLDSKLAAEVKVNNIDLSYIHLGQEVAMRLDAFPNNQYGRLFGKVEAISPSTIEDKEGHVFYIIRVKLGKQNMEDKQGLIRPLRAGMTVTADIITRKRNIFSFFLDPLKETLNTAFKDPADR